MLYIKISKIQIIYNLKKFLIYFIFINIYNVSINYDLKLKINYYK